MLEGDGVCLLGAEEHPVRVGSVVVRPPGTGVAHAIRAGAAGITYLAYGDRIADDMCYYPRSNKISFGFAGLIGRLEKLDYWDGEGTRRAAKPRGRRRGLADAHLSRAGRRAPSDPGARVARRGAQAARRLLRLASSALAASTAPPALAP